MRIFKVVLTGMASLLTATAALGADSPNLLINPDLKDGKDGKPAGWTFSLSLAQGSGEWTTDASACGEKILKLQVKTLKSPEVNYSGASWNSEFVQVSPETQLKIGGWMKGEDIVAGKGYFKLRVVCTFFDSSRQRISHKDIASRDGTFDWMQFSGSPAVPKNAAYANLSCNLTACTGTAYFRNFSMISRTCDPIADMTLTSIEGPIVIPKPWKAAYGKIISTSSMASLNAGADEAPAIVEELNAALKKAGFSVAAARKEANGLTVNVLTSPDSIEEPGLKKRLLEAWKTLPDDGYLVEVVDSPSPKAYLLGRAPADRYYALQTFKCMLLDGGRVWSGSIADYPELALRGSPLGPQWWNKMDEALDRLSSLKCNYIVSHGSLYFGAKLGFGEGKARAATWREPFNDTDIKAFKSYLAKCKKHFITPCLAFRTRGNPATVYSSTPESQIVIDKIKILHDMGFHDFSLAFDDLQNIGQDVLTDEEDKKLYGDNMGEAHYAFISRIYEGVSKLPDINITVLPLWYSAFETLTERRRGYLASLSKLPPEINMMYCEARPSGLAAFTKFMKRKNPPQIWDNFFATWSDVGVKMTFNPPLERPKEYSKENVGAYVTLVAIPHYEDIGLSSWNTMADYMWAPSRYNPQDSLNRAVVKRLGQEATARKFMDYASFMKKSLSFAPDTKDKESRIRSIKAMAAEFKTWRDRMSDVPDKAMKESIDVEIARRLSDMDELLAAMDGKDFPFVVQRAATTPALDGDIDGDPAWKDVPAKTGFLNVKNGKPVERQTSFKMCYDDQNLYIAISCMEDQPERIVAKVKERDRYVYQDDCVELFLDTRQSMETYFHIVVNSLGAIYDSNRIKKTWFTAEEKEWNAGMTVATKRFADKWTVEIALPLKEFGGAPGARWNFNIGRERQIDPKECSTYARLLKSGFHDPDRFWTLEFAK